MKHSKWNIYGNLWEIDGKLPAFHASFEWENDDKLKARAKHLAPTPDPQIGHGSLIKNRCDWMVDETMAKPLVN